MNELVIAIIGAGGSAFGALVGIVVNTKLINYRIEQLENKVNKHNTLIDRTYKLEEKSTILEEKLQVANHRISDLENKEV